MKKSTLLLLIVLAVSALPALSADSLFSLKKAENPFYKGEACTVTLKGKEYQLGNVYGTPLRTKAGPEDVIREAEGTEKLYLKESAGTALLGKEMVLYEDEFPGRVVWGENNEVFVRDILSTIPTETYVKGNLSDGVITFAAGQLIEYIEEKGYDPYGIAIGVGKTVINEAENKVDFYYDPTLTEFTIKVDKKGNMELVLPGEPFDGENPSEYILCLYYTDDLEFAGYSDFSQTYTEVNYELIKMPYGAEPELYVYIDNFDYAAYVQVVYTDDYLYIKGLDPLVPEGVVRAKIDGNTATIAQNEYVGIYLDSYFIFTKVAMDNPDYNPFNPATDPYIFAPEDQGFLLTFDREAGTITSNNKGVYLSFQPNVNNFNNVNCFLEEFILKYQSSAAGTPANPSALRFFTAQAYYWGFTDFQFTISNYSTEGHLLDVEHLYYQVVVNGEPIIFEEAPLINLNGEEALAYTGIPEKQSWLPYLFLNYKDIDKWNENMFDIGIYVEDVKTLGVQSMYIYEGVYTYSKLMTLDVETGEVTESEGAGVKGITDASVVKEEYYRLDGLKVSEPKNGIFVKRTIYSDGKTVVTKQLIP